ncbi:hypothetical protein [Heyndrickxia acidicola]|uniref:Lipoprotein n=1 Tax=Heyndrickxia acidicola TaxID=209389 RepID=A0ABU6MEB8_9BACI|nr:hypothetical protein [Heyndrickxia acidicola]MED1203006.1 hypothetical protein [Heyndrickxia acidicola]
MKRAFILFAALALSLAGCSFSSSTGSSQSDKTSQNKSTETANSQNGSTGQNNGSDSSRSNQSSSSSQTASNSSSQTSTSNAQTSSNRTLTMQEVIKATEQQLKTQVPVRLPNALPMDKGYHLTAVTESDRTHYSVTFYESKNPIPINNSKLTNGNDAIKIGTVKGTLYKTDAQAGSYINYQDFKKFESGNPSTNLGYGIKGYFDAGAGSEYLGWNEGRWSFTVRARTVNGSILHTAGRQIVAYLEKEMLPPPHNIGAGEFIADELASRNQRISWQNKNVIYEVSDTKDAMTALKIATAF